MKKCINAKSTKILWQLRDIENHLNIHVLIRDTERNLNNHNDMNHISSSAKVLAYIDNTLTEPMGLLILRLSLYVYYLNIASVWLR